MSDATEKHLKLQRWALIAEIIGGIAIVVTLVFVVFEIRSNTNAVQAQTYQDLMRDLNEFRRMTGTREQAEMRDKYFEMGWNGLSSTEQRMTRASASVRWGIYESAYYAYERGVLGEREWARFEAAICRGLTTDRALWSPEGSPSMDDLLTSTFVDYLSSACE